MRGRAQNQSSMLCLLSPESRVPLEHPLRGIKAIADRALRCLAETFDAMYARDGRPSVPPERLLKGQLLLALYSIRSERQRCDQLEYTSFFAGSSIWTCSSQPSMPARTRETANG